jgi:hypothetical protein
MQFHTIFTEKRVGSDKIPSGPRSGFQRDFDRLIFSSAFRRLQNKTQVFPCRVPFLCTTGLPIHLKWLRLAARSVKWWRTHQRCI